MIKVQGHVHYGFQSHEDKFPLLQLRLFDLGSDSPCQLQPVLAGSSALATGAWDWREAPTVRGPGH